MNKKRKRGSYKEMVTAANKLVSEGLNSRSGNIALMLLIVRRQAHTKISELNFV